MEKKYKEKVLKPFQAHGKEWNRGDVYREVSISETDAKRLNERKADFGFEYELIETEEKDEQKKPGRPAKN
jgi:hypothetical protein